MKKFNNGLNIAIGGFIGVFVGYCIYIYWEYKTFPEIYAMQSAPWYTSILLNGALTIAVVAICAIIKMIIKHYIKKSNRKENE